MDQPWLKPALRHLSEPRIVLDGDFVCVWESVLYCVKTPPSLVNQEGKGACQGTCADEEECW